MGPFFLEEDFMPFSRFLATALIICALPVTAMAQATPPAAAQAPAIAAPTANTPAQAVSDSRPVTRGELPALIEETLANNPEMIIKAVQKMRDKQMAESRIRSKEALQKYKGEIASDTESPMVGSSNPDITIVEFFDYHCGYCKQLLPAIAQIVKDDSKVRFIMKEFPILSEDSVAASRAALAVNRMSKDKYFGFHQALMKNQGKFDEKTVMDIAKKQGIDTSKLKAEMARPEITAILDKNRAMAEALGISGTPALIIGDEVTPGAVSYDELRKMIENVRAGKSATATDAPAAAPVMAPAAAPAAPAAPSAPVAAPAAPKN
jgi:protein-disulfide isomerase